MDHDVHTINPVTDARQFWGEGARLDVYKIAGSADVFLEIETEGGGEPQHVRLSKLAAIELMAYLSEVTA